MTKTPGTILFISNDASRTGAPIFLLRLLRWLRDNRDYSFRTLVGRYGDLVPDFEALGPVNYFEPKPTVAYKGLRRLKMNGLYRAGHQEALAAELSGLDIRLIYCNTIANGEILEFLSFLRCPVICHVHELESVIGHLGQHNLDLISHYASQYIAVSEAVKSNLSEKHDIPEEKIRLIHGFIPRPAVVSPGTVSSRAAVRQELGIPPQSKVVCACGSLEHRKGADLFLRVAQSVQSTDKSGTVHFVWVGGQPRQVNELRREIQSSSLRDNVHFVGSKPEMTPYYDASDIFLLTSREDPFPLVMLEAASRELPIVCFGNSGGAPEFVGNDAGVVVPGFDTTEMAKEVMRLLSAPALGRQIGEAAQRKVMEHHTLDAGAPKIAQVIEKALQGMEHPVEA